MSNVSKVLIEDVVRIMSADGKLSDQTYVVTGFSDEIIELRNTDTGDEHGVHRTRVAEVLRGGEVITVTDDSDDEDIKKKAKAKVKSKTKTKKKREKLDVKAMAVDGDIWSKESSFPHADTKVIAYCQFLADGSGFRCFNTYNGCLGKKQETIKTYGFDTITAEDKQKKLTKKGYTLAYAKL